ncbi:hypothetical protein [Leptolyngbya sp. 7M]|uniref:hypothetical protein n=1 Tax=Leptolyngbya sp. 7M TaxID=2812896 RepID=UPI0021F21584|nr:hypothetical protein [Leptolyngbya sp. 7M]
MNCACVGGNSKAPLGVVSFAENAIMAVMGGMLTFSSLSEANIQPLQSLEALPPAVVQLQEGNREAR